MMSLGANLAGKLQGIHHSLLSRLDLPQGQSSFEAQLEVVTKYFKDLLIRNLESLKLIDFLVEPGLTLHSEHNLIIFVHDRLDEVLMRFHPRFDIVWLFKGGHSNLSFCLTDSIDPFSSFHGEFLHLDPICV